MVTCGAVTAGIMSAEEPVTGPSVVEEPFTDAGWNSAATSGGCSCSSSTTSKTLPPDPSSFRASANSRLFSVRAR